MILEKSTNILIRGSGSIARKYIQCLIEIGYEKIDVLTSEKYWHGFPIRNSAIRLIKEGDLRSNYDLLIIASQTKCHLADFEKYGDLGSKILIEKPLSHRVPSDLKLVKKLKQKNIFVSSPLRFHENFATLRQQLERLGTIKNVEIGFGSWLPDWRRDRSVQYGYWSDPEQGGVLRDMVHEIDYALVLFGKPELLVCKLQSGAEIFQIQVDAIADIEWQTQTGIDVSIHLSYVEKMNSRFMRVTGDKGLLLWDLLAGTLSTDTGGKMNIIENLQVSPMLALRKQLESIVAINSSVLPSNVGDAVNTLSIIEAARLSDNFNREQRVRYLESY